MAPPDLGSRSDRGGLRAAARASGARCPARTGASTTHRAPRGLGSRVFSRPRGAAAAGPESLPTYWYGDEAVNRRVRSMAVLEALRVYRAAEMAMRRRTRDSMSMGENELLVLRYLLREPARRVRPGELTRYLGLSTASTTAILDRLERSGRVTRAANPDDRRSIFIEATELAHSEVRATLGNMHDRMLAAVIDMEPEESAVVVGFLKRMSDAVDGVAVETGSSDSP